MTDNRPADVQAKVEAAREELTVFVPDTRGVTLSRWGKGNTKLGPDVYTYSRLPGRAYTCPGSTDECEHICYAKRVVEEHGIVQLIWTANSGSDEVPSELPPGAKIVRFHVSGDFDTVEYIYQWTELTDHYPWVRFFGYTRSWRVPELLPALERLRGRYNVQLFASMDKSMTELPPKGWRRAWLEDDLRAFANGHISPHNGFSVALAGDADTFFPAQPSLVCPEETGRKASCQACRYCIDGQRGDVVFLLH